MIHRSLQLPGPRGGTLRAELRVREGPPPRSAVVVVHGFKGFKDWGFFPHLCTALAVQGHAVVSFDFSLNGVETDGGDISELEAFSRNTYSREVDELNHVVEMVARGDLTPRPPRRMGILGHSRGGAMAILSTRESPQVDALATWAAIDHLDRWTEETLEEWKRKGVIHVFEERLGIHLPVSVDLLDDYLAQAQRLNVHAAAQEVEVPWLIVHGREDLTVPWEEGEALARVSGRARLSFLEGAGHTLEVTHPLQEVTPALDQAIRLSTEHFERHLGGD